MRVIVMHHNPLRGELSNRYGLSHSERAARAFVDLHVDLVLCGHDHQEGVQHVEHTPFGTVVCTAGTVSNRTRGQRPSAMNIVDAHAAGDRDRAADLVGRHTELSPGNQPTLRSMRAFVAARINQLFQLFLEFDEPPRTAEQLLHRLRVYGLKGITTVRLTSNRAVMVSFKGAELRVHRGYLNAPRGCAARDRAVRAGTHARGAAARTAGDPRASRGGDAPRAGAPAGAAGPARSRDAARARALASGVQPRGTSAAR